MTDIQNPFWNSPTYKIVQAMKATGNRPGIIRQWKEMVERWALLNPGPDADAVAAWLPNWQIRPFYSAAELAPIFPALALALRITRRMEPMKSPARLAHELDYVGLPQIILCGEIYYIVERIHYWKKEPLACAMEELARVAS